jgi:hypothetical protein
MKFLLHKRHYVSEHKPYHRSVPTRGGGGEEPAIRKGARGPHYVAYIFVFLGSIRFNYVLVCRVDVT